MKNSTRKKNIEFLCYVEKYSIAK